LEPNASWSWVDNEGKVLENAPQNFQILTGTPIGKRSVGRPRHKWEDNIRMDLKKDKDYCRTLVNAALNLQIP
jgi:hypothetical protein